MDFKAFPLLSVGIYNFELFEGIWIAVWTILRHFEKNERSVRFFFTVVFILLLEN